MTIPLEDLCNDIIGKAMRGLGLSENELTEKANISKDQLHLLLSGQYDEQDVRLAAKALQLNPDALVVSAQQAWSPQVATINGLASAHTNFGDMIINAYVVWDPKTKEGAIFDTGMDASGLIDTIQKNNISPKTLYLTHTHTDHIADIDSIKKTFPEITIYSHLAELLPGNKGLSDGFMDTLGNLSLKAIETSGHSPGGTTYYIQGLAQPVAIVGDSLFSGSMGKATTANYPQALSNNKDKILKLPDNTILCPGHGPLTTVEQEKQHNPFFA